MHEHGNQDMGVGRVGGPTIDPKLHLFASVFSWVNGDERLELRNQHVCNFCMSLPEFISANLGQEPGEEFLKLCLIFPGNQLEFWKLLVAKALHGPGDCDDQEFPRSLEKFLGAFLERSYGHPYSILPLKNGTTLEHHR